MAKTKSSVIKKIKKYIELLNNNISISAAVLFGSYVNGKPNEYSDIDIAVFSKNFGKNPLAEAELLFRVRRKIDTDIEPLPFHSSKLKTKDKTDFCYEILNKGIFIYKEGNYLI